MNLDLDISERPDIVDKLTNIDEQILSQLDKQNKFKNLNDTYHAPFGHVPVEPYRARKFAGKPVVFDPDVLLKQKHPCKKDPEDLTSTMTGSERLKSVRQIIFFYSVP